LGEADGGAAESLTQGLGGSFASTVSRKPDSQRLALANAALKTGGSGGRINSEVTVKLTKTVIKSELQNAVNTVGQS
jgi:hypothetical protein